MGNNLILAISFGFKLNSNLEQLPKITSCLTCVAWSEVGEHSFFMGGGGGFWVGHPKIFELKEGSSQKLRGKRGLQVSVLV